LGGISAVILLGRSVPGGWSGIIDQASAAGKLQAIDWYTGIDRPHTVLAGLLGGAFLAMASHGADQLIVQRLLSAKKLRDAQIAVIGSGVAVLCQFALFLMVGVGLWAYFGGRAFTAPDLIFPTFIVEKMPQGLLGLILAAIVAATMSTHSGAINSLAASTTHDIYLPLSGRKADDPRTLRMGKMFALLWGTGLTLAALLFKEQGTPMVVIALGIASFTQGALLGGFFLGIFWRRAMQRGAILGMGVAIFVMAFIVFARQVSTWFPETAGFLAPFGRVAWPWYVLIGTSLTLLVGILSSYTHAPPTGVRREVR
jgi:solute:Na+ symporter, SSS family